MIAMIAHVPRRFLPVLLTLVVTAGSAVWTVPLVGSRAASAAAAPAMAAQAGRVLYVDEEDGSDEGTGAADEPFDTIGQAAALVQPGDRVEIAEGTYDEEVELTVSGTPDAPITFAAAPGAEVEIEEEGITVAADYVELEALTVTDNDDDDRGGILIAGGRGIVIRDVIARDNDGNGLRVKPQTAPVADLLVVGGEFRDNGNAGIAATGEGELTLSGVTIEGVTARDNGRDGVRVERAQDVTVTGGVMDANGRDSDRNGLLLKEVVNGRVSSVLARGNGHNGVALRAVDDVVVERTVSTENGHHGFDSIEYCRNVAYVNNVAFDNGRDDEDKGLYVTATDGIRILNNIFVGNDGDQLAFSNQGGPVANVVSDHNLLWRSDDGRLVRWFDAYLEELRPYQTASGLDIGSITSDPGFADPDDGDFQLLPDSPAIDAGADVPGVTDDFCGEAPDLGAFEHGCDDAAARAATD